MKLAIGLCFLTSAAVAQVVGDGMGSPYGGSKAAVTYIGPGDVVSGATAWYGLRAYSSARVGGTTKAVNLRRASDNTTCDFDINTSGNLGGTDSGCGTGTGLSLAVFATQDATCTGTIASTTLTCASASSTPHVGSTLTGTGITQPSFIASCGTFTGGAGTCTLNSAQTVSVGETITMTYGLYVTEVYDQSGANGCSSAPCNVTQSTAGNQPQLLPTCNNLVPCINFNGTSNVLTLSGFPVLTSPLSTDVVIQPTSTVGGRVYQGAIGNVNDFIEYQNASTTFNALNSSGLISKTITTGQYISAQAVYNGTPSFMVVGNSAGSTSTLGTGSSPGGLQIGEGFGSFYSGTIYQVGFWETAFTSTPYGSLCHNAYGYYATSPSC